MVVNAPLINERCCRASLVQLISYQRQFGLFLSEQEEN